MGYNAVVKGEFMIHQGRMGMTRRRKCAADGALPPPDSVARPKQSKWPINSQKSNLIRLNQTKKTTMLGCFVVLNPLFIIIYTNITSCRQGNPGESDQIKLMAGTCHLTQRYL